MLPISVVIITKNEALVIGQTLTSVSGLTDDVVVVDTGSTDGTVEIAVAAGARVISATWEGFGPTKNNGIATAKYDWILSIDSDERPDEKLIEALGNVDFSNVKTVYNIRFHTFLGNKHIRYGEWGRDAHIRFFHRGAVCWNDAKVHERLIIPSGTNTRTLHGHILHYTVKNVADYALKMTNYALLSGENYFRNGKKAGIIKRWFSPGFSFVQNYIFKLGFLDGWEGLLIARVTAFYTLLKYARLHELNKRSNK